MAWLEFSWFRIASICEPLQTLSSKFECCKMSCLVSLTDYYRSEYPFCGVTLNCVLVPRCVLEAGPLTPHQKAFQLRVTAEKAMTKQYLHIAPKER
jgi:hypothetical protein